MFTLKALPILFLAFVVGPLQLLHALILTWREQECSRIEFAARVVMFGSVAWFVAFIAHHRYLA